MYECTWVGSSSLERTPLGTVAGRTRHCLLTYADTVYTSVNAGYHQLHVNVLSSLFFIFFKLVTNLSTNCGSWLYSGGSAFYDILILKTSPMFLLLGPPK